IRNEEREFPTCRRLDPAGCHVEIVLCELLPDLSARHRLNFKFAAGTQGQLRDDIGVDPDTLMVERAKFIEGNVDGTITAESLRVRRREGFSVSYQKKPSGKADHMKPPRKHNLLPESLSPSDAVCHQLMSTQPIIARIS